MAMQWCLVRDSMAVQNYSPGFHTGSPHTETCRQTKKFPFGDSPFPNRVCAHFRINIYTNGISIPIHMVQYCDSFSWSKYCCCLFPNDLSRMISEMNNVDELFCQNMSEFLQTDIDGSVDFLLNATTIELLDKYLKTFYTPPLGIDQISYTWDQFFLIQKYWTLSLRKNGNLQAKQRLFLFQSSSQ